MSENVSGVEKKESKSSQLTERSEGNLKATNSETNVEIPESIQCEVCKKSDEVTFSNFRNQCANQFHQLVVRIVLRQCGHVICLPCILEHVKHRIVLDGHPRFKCQVPSCDQLVHENDINAVLDEKEPALEMYMPISHRRYLQHKQNKHSITAALPSADLKRCPLCRAIYIREPGCNYVICANSACATAFCWQCEKPIGRPISHYTTASTCRLGYTDYERLLRTVQMVLDVNFIVLWIFLPFVYLIALVYIPILIIFLVPASLAYQEFRKEKDNHEYLLPVDVGMIIFKIIVGILLGILACLPLAIGSIASGFVIIFFYVCFLFIRMIPCGLSGDRVNSVLCLMRWAGRLLRIGPYAKLLNEAKKEREGAMLKLEENQDDFENAIESGNPSSTTTTNTSSSGVENNTSVTSQNLKTTETSSSNLELNRGSQNPPP